MSVPIGSKFVDECIEGVIPCISHNEILPRTDRFLHWYQFVNLGVGAGAFVLPLVFYSILALVRSYQRRKEKARLRKEDEKPKISDKTAPNSASGNQQFPACHGVFALPFVYPPHSAGDDDADESLIDQRDAASVSSSVDSSIKASLNRRLGCIDLASLGPGALVDDVTVSQTAERLLLECSAHNFAALALRCGPGSSQRRVEKLIAKLADRIPVMLMCHHDSNLWQRIPLKNTVGVVVENATMLSNGDRRNYFQSKGLRHIMGYAAIERDSKPEFFVGFLDLWEEKPHPAAIRRAVKLAEHFGASVEHGRYPLTPACQEFAGRAGISLSAFEYLKRSEITKLQSVWCQASRKVKIGPQTNSATKVTPLDANSLVSLIPSAPELLRHEPLPSSLISLRTEVPSVLESPTYVALAPKCDDFWHTSRDATALSPAGCFSIYTEPTFEDYTAIVQTQMHLKELNLLLLTEGSDCARLIQTLRALPTTGRCGPMVQNLIKGLEAQEVCVYKGMDTGFRLPEGAASFWGVSMHRDGESATSADIFISQKAPSFAAAVLHSWLAHHRVPRDLRFEYEAMLETANGPKKSVTTLPSSIASSIKASTHAETLQLLQRIQVTGLQGRLKEAIIRACQVVLLDQTTTSQRVYNYARRLLDGTMTMREALGSRLEDLARLGASQLPALDNLVELHELVEESVRDGLFIGDRGRLNIFALSLIECFDLYSADPSEYIDVNADLFALIFFSVIRRAAFEEVYIESTDRCPLLLQPDQAAVFSELWVLGSQCEIYFGILPRDLGECIYMRYTESLGHRPPMVTDRIDNEIMTMYFDASAAKVPKRKDKSGLPALQRTMHERVERLKRDFAQFGATSFFCLPAVIDVVLLTFLGRGLLMTAFMDEAVKPAVYGVLISLLLSAGIVGWVGSTGNYYLAHYAYDNMIHFHISRLSSGFVLSFVIGWIGVILFWVLQNVEAAWIFFAYVIGVTTYLNLLGILATMHQPNCPLTSGRSVAWRTIPLLFLSPIISMFVPGYDLAVYLTVLYVFLFVLLFQYRLLCHEWSGWMNNINKFGEKDIVDWYTKKVASQVSEKAADTVDTKDALEAFKTAVSGYQRRTAEARSSGILNDSFVAKVVKGLPYIDWLFKKGAGAANLPPRFSSGWFTQLGEAQNQQRQLIRGLKEHNIVILFRMARWDIAQSVGLFLIALMDRWVTIVMDGRSTDTSIYDDRDPIPGPLPGEFFTPFQPARYGLCFCIVYFCLSVMVLDLVLKDYWSLRFEASKEPLVDYQHAQAVARKSESVRRKAFVKAFFELLSKLAVGFGAMTVLLWLFVDTAQTTSLYYLYILGYTCVIVFQFNRCFTTNLEAHIITIFVSAFCGFVIGCVLRGLPETKDWAYSATLGQTSAAVLAAIGTSLWSWKDLFAKKTDPLAYSDVVIDERSRTWTQRKLRARTGVRHRVSSILRNRLGGRLSKHGDDSPLAKEVGKLLHTSFDNRNDIALSTPGSGELLQKAVTMWETGRIVILSVPSESFASFGLEDVCSYSQMDDSGILNITMGMFGETELGLLTWRPMIATVAAEAVLFHVAQVQYDLSNAQAVQAEHFLYSTVSMSKRIEIELVVADADDLQQYMRKTNKELMRHLCWDLDVDVDWESTPQIVRKAIISRIAESPAVATEELRQWLDNSGISPHTMDFHLDLALSVYRSCCRRYDSVAFLHEGEEIPVSNLAAELAPVRIENLQSSGLSRIVMFLTEIPLRAMKWMAILSGGATNVERELSFRLRPVFLGRPFLWVTLIAWRLCKVLREFWIYTMIVYKRDSLDKVARLAFSGEQRQITKKSVIIQRTRKPVTAFATAAGEGLEYMTINAFDGSLSAVPEGKTAVFKATYDDNFRLTRREDQDGVVSTYSYSSNKDKRWPLYREVISGTTRTVGFYDKYGRVKHGTMSMDKSVEITFNYHYKATPKGTSNILRADFSHGSNSNNVTTLSVFWGEPPRENSERCDWVPSDKVYRVTRTVDGKTYITDMEYRHRRDPVSHTVLEEGASIRTVIAKVPTIFFEKPLLLVKPKRLSFDADDLLIHHSTLHVGRMRHSVAHTLSLASRWSPAHLFGRNITVTLPTWRLRTELWHSWLQGNIDAPTVCWFDEIILRKEPLLHAYWRAREAGRLDLARSLLDDKINQIVSAIELETDVSELCLLPIKTTDLYAMGLGRDATEVTARPQDCYADTKDRVSVIVNDIGCWPESPGGVSNCRRDLVNGHSTIRNHVLAECANDFGIPRFQVERNVQSLQLLPLWGLDDKTAYHGLTENLLQSQVDDKIANTDKQRDISGVFVPLLIEFVKGARTKTYTRADLIKYTNTFLSMSKYFEHKDYNLTWNSKAVEDAWADSWLIPYNDSNISDPRQHFEMQRPSRSDFREAMGIIMAYFFIFSVAIPDECPRVFQSTHHGISSMFGMILKYRRGVTFGIWDHAILWRETCLNISPAQCELSIPVQAMLLGGIRLASRLAYFHADMIVPCTSLFNPMWETDIGTDRGRLSNKNAFVRKIDPIVNGISNMDSFAPTSSTRTGRPTAVMLSNVQFIKGIRTAIVAADVIVNRYGFRDYKLLIYGAKDRQPAYALEMAKLIVSCNLSDNVILAGFGKPDKVLQDAWLFVNSSISEGLPLAIGEAALAGVPIVATEVGATALVITDPDNEEQRYGEVVPPNDPVSLARAQLKLLCMVGPWGKFTDDGNTEAARDLPEDFTADDVTRLSKRMYEKGDDRHKLGLLSREVVKRSFHGHRYLREHEQMYWIQWHVARMRSDNTLNQRSRTSYRFNAPPPLVYTEAPLRTDEDVDSAAEIDMSTLHGSTRSSICLESQTPTRFSRPSGISRLLLKQPLTEPPSRPSSRPSTPRARSHYESWAPPSQSYQID